MTPDDPDLSDLRAALDAATPRPDPAVRAAHLRLARERFALQARPRPSPRGRQRLAALPGSLAGRGGLTAATALAACGVLLLIPAGQDLWRPFAPAEREEAALPPPEPPREGPATAPTEAGPEAADAPPPAGAAPELRPAGDAVESAPAAQDLAVAPGPAAGAKAAPETAMTGPAVGPQAEGVAPEPPAADAPRSVLVDSDRAMAAPASPEAAQAAPEASVAQDLAVQEVPGAVADTARAGPEAALAPEAPSFPAGGYAALRRSLREGRLPEAVEIGDLVNGVPYDLPTSRGGPVPAVSVLPAPWSPVTRLVVVQIEGAGGPAVPDLRAEVDWNPAAVADPRPVGEAPLSGGLSAGQPLTLLFEVTPVFEVTPADGPEDLGTLRLRWTDPASGAGRLLEVPVTGREPAGTEARFAAALAHWGLLLRGEAQGWDDALALAEASRGPDPLGLRAEAIDLMRLSESLGP